MLALRPKIEQYRPISNCEKLSSEWHLLCLESAGYERWRKQQLFNKGVFDLAFSGLAAKAYLALFELRLSDLPHCTPLTVTKIASLSKQLSETLPASKSLLPSDAQKPAFHKALNDLICWRPSDLREGSSGHGDPIRRWLIREIAVEFCYATATHPTVAVVGDLIRLGWPEMQDRSIRNTLTESLLNEAMAVANTRRNNDNQATTITHQTLAKASANASQTRAITPDTAKETSLPDVELISSMEQLAANFSDDAMRKRALSFMQALRDEMGFSQEETDEGN